MAFDERKVAQMAAYFLQRNGGPLSIIKLMKLLYLADRRSLDWFEYPMSGDRMVSMPHGPVLSQTLELMNGASRPNKDGWDCWIADRAGHMLSLKDCQGSEPGRELDLDCLSEADVDVLESTFQEFGGMGQWELRDFTHSSACPEWVDPKGSSYPIEYEDVLKALGRSEEEAREAQQALESQHKVERIFERIRCS